MNVPGHASRKYLIMVYENNKEKKQKRYLQKTVKEAYYPWFDLAGCDS